MDKSKLEKIIKECFWDLNMQPSDIYGIVNGDDFRKKAFLFEKIVLNSASMIRDLKIFKEQDLRLLIENYKIPNFNRAHAFKRRNIAEVFFLNKPLLIDELRWMS